MTKKRSIHIAFIVAAILYLLFAFMTLGVPMAWAVCVNDSADCGAVITITQDSMPYTIPAGNTYYRFSGDLTSTGTGITVDGKDNWQLDGNDFNLTFSTDGGNNENGIHGDWSTDAFRIKNLSVLYGADSAEAHSAQNCDAIELFHADSVILENLYITYGGYDACGIDIVSGGGQDVTIRHVTCSSMVHSQTTRSDYRTSGIRFHGFEQQSYDVYSIKIDTCRMVNMLHSGFYLACGDTGQNVCAHKPLIYLNCDSIWVDVRNRNYTDQEGDPFGITTYTIGPGSYIKNCYINGTPSNPGSKTTGNGGNGIFLQGIQGTSGNHVEICNNKVIAGFQCKSGGTSSHYAIALYFRWAEAEHHHWSAYVDIHDNEFWGYGDSANWPLRIETVRFAIDSGFQGIHFYNNQCYAIQKDSAAGHYLDSINFAIGIGAMDSTRDERTAQGTEVYDNRDNIWYNNYYYSNTNNPLEFGAQANHELGGGGIIMFGDTVYRGINSNDSAAVVFCRNAYRHSSTGSRVIDLTCLGHTRDTVKFRTITQDDDCEGKDVTYQRQVEVVVEDSLGNPIGGANVWIWDNYNDTSTIKVTDGAGKIYDTLTYAKYHYVSPLAGDSCNWVDSVSYNNRYIKASHGGLADSITATINIAWDGSDTVSLATSNPPATGKGVVFGK